MHRRNCGRLAWLLVVLVSLLLGVAGAGAAQEQIVIRMYGGYDYRVDGGTGPAEILDRYLRMYEELNPHVKIENLGRELNVDKLVTMYLAGELPDIIEIDVKFLADFYRIGMLAPVPEWLAEKLRQQMFPSSVDFITVDGRMVGIPGENMVTGLIYNRRVLGEAGLAEPPQTIDELESVGRLLTRMSAEGIVERPALIESGGWALNHLALAMYATEGGEAFTPDGELAVGGPALQRTMERLVRWLQPDSFFAREGFNAEFARGEIAMGIGYPWWLSGIKIEYPDDYVRDFGVTLMPMGPSFGAFKYGHGYGVNKASKHIDEVWKLLEWLSLTVIEDITPIGHMLANLGSLPNVPSDILSVQYAFDRPFYEGFIQNLDYVKNTPAWERINIADPAVKVAEGELNIPAAIEEVITLARAEMARHQTWIEERQQ